MAKQENVKKNLIIENIKDNFAQIESSIVDQLWMANKLHGTTTGSHREDVWKELFEMIIPKKFVMEHSVFIIDSHGEVSCEVDLAIIDEMYTPYIFRKGRLKFVPIEAVAVVVECKSTGLKKADLKNWVTSIQKLRTATNSITRLATGISIGPALTQKSTRPVRILCALEKPSKPISKLFDFTLVANNTEELNGHRKIELMIQCVSENKALIKWHKDLNAYEANLNKGTDSNFIKVLDPSKKEVFEKQCLKNYAISDCNLLTFNFQLNQLLMIINNPILFPHLDYVDLFNGKSKKVELSKDKITNLEVATDGK